MKKLLFIKLVLLITFTTILAQAQTWNRDYVEFKAFPTKSVVNAGEEFELQLNMDIIDYWYTYSTEMQLSDEGIGPSQTFIEFKSNDKIEPIGEVIIPKPQSKYDEGFEMDITYFSGKSQFVLKGKAKEKIDFSIDSVFVNVYAQFCDTVKCMPPEDFFVLVENSPISEAVASMVGFEKPKKAKKEIITVGEGGDSGKDKKEDTGLMAFLLMAAGFGMAAWVMPCVFPMIPITVSFFTKRSEKANSQGIFDATLYLVGIVITFTLIGILAGLILGPSGGQDIATNPYINFLLAAVFILIAFSLFGAFEIQIPTSWVNKLNLKTQGSGKLPIIMMGIVFSLTSFACTVPFVAGIMANMDDSLLRPTLGFMTYSLVFAFPFFFFALFPSWMKKLPKSGGWMNNVKVIMGFLELAFAIKFLSNMDLTLNLGLLPRDIFLSIWIACSILIVFYILGMFKLKIDSPLDSVGPVRAMWAVVFMSATIYLFSGLYGKSLGELDAFLPPDDYGQELTSSSGSMGGSTSNGGMDLAEHHWVRSLDEGIEIAKRENKKIFLDFTGWNCTNCRLMEKKVFPIKDIHNALNEFVLVRLYTDRQNEEEQANKQYQMDKFNMVSLPYYAIITPDEEVIATEAFNRNANEFLDFLNKGIDHTLN